MSHRDAPTTFQGRLLIVERRQAGWAKAHIAEAMGLSRACVHKWIKRHAEEGEAGLHDRSSRPHRCPRRATAAVEQRILACRRQQQRGQDWIGPELGVPARTVCRVLRRHRCPTCASATP